MGIEAFRPLLRGRDGEWKLVQIEVYPVHDLKPEHPGGLNDQLFL